MSNIANVKKDMVILEKSEFSALRAENEVKPLCYANILSAKTLSCTHLEGHKEITQSDCTGLHS